MVVTAACVAGESRKMFELIGAAIDLILILVVELVCGAVLFHACREKEIYSFLSGKKIALKDRPVAFSLTFSFFAFAGVGFLFLHIILDGIW